MHFQKSEEGFVGRAQKFLAQERTQEWRMDRSEEEILKEFEEIEKWREHIWHKDPTADTLEPREEFRISQTLLINRPYKKANLVAFEYNNTHPKYNSSTIVLNGHKILALEAPSQENVQDFFNLLRHTHVTHLVRLTPAMEEGVFKSYPYWEGKEELYPETQEMFLDIPFEGKEDKSSLYKVRYVWTDAWKDHHAIAVTDLLKLILEVKKRYNSTSLLAIHCHAGVARTGTFIAGFIVLDEIDKQIAKGKKPEELDISIEKVVKQLSLQRFYMVGKPKQYLMLYRLVDFYVKQFQQKNKK